MTTNTPEELDTIFKNRPGRVDRNIRIELPRKKLRKEFLEHYLKKYKFKHIKELNDIILPMTDGLNFAQMDEVLRTLVLEKIIRKVTTESRNKIEGIIKNLKEKKKIMGFIPDE